MDYSKLHQYYQQQLQEFIQEAGNKPGWILDQDPELAAKIRSHKRDLAALKKWAGRPIPKKDDQEQHTEEGLRDPKDNPCWKGYKPVGTKKKNGRTVPNCVPRESLDETAPAMPDVQGIKPGETRDLGSGTRVTVNTDGTVSYTGGFGQYVYDQSGRVIKQQSPSMGGFSQEHDPVTGQSKTNYNKGPMSVSQDSQGKASAEYTLGSEKFTASNENAESGTRSTISGDEDHDEMSKLLVQRLRRLAGL